MHSLRQFVLLGPELFLAPPECRNFRIVKTGAELLKSVHFPLNGGNFALHPKLLQFPGTTEWWAWGQPFGRDAGDEMGLYWI